MCQKMIDDGKIKDVAELPVYFAKEVSEMVKGHGFSTLQAWEDGLKYATDASVFATDKTRVNFWETLYWGGFNEAMKWAHKGYDVVLSTRITSTSTSRTRYTRPSAATTGPPASTTPARCSPSPRKTCRRTPRPRLTATATPSWPRVTRIRSSSRISGQQWSETVRTDAQYEYMVYPRIFSMAERAWHKGGFELDYVKNREFSGTTKFVNKATLNKEWNQFANVLGQRVLPKLTRPGWNTASRTGRQGGERRAGSKRGSAGSAHPVQPGWQELERLRRCRQADRGWQGLPAYYQLRWQAHQPRHRAELIAFNP